MNYIKHLTGFFEKVTDDRNLNPTHISLYIALFQFWNCNRFKNPISISRDEVMRISKISSKATYHKCMKALHFQGYLKYEPSYNPFKGSHVVMFSFAEDLKPLLKSERVASSIFKPDDGQVLNKSGTGTDPSAVQDAKQLLVPSINNTNIIKNKKNLNSLNIGELKKTNKVTNHLFFKSADIEKKQSDDLTQSGPPLNLESGHYDTDRSVENKEKSCVKKESPGLHENEATSSSPDYIHLSASDKPDPINQSRHTPTIAEAISYFREQNFPEPEANKFYNYFKSVGWLIGGKTPMVDWQAAANNWMLNVPIFASNDTIDRTTNLKTSARKDYSEPL